MNEAGTRLWRIDAGTNAVRSEVELTTTGYGPAEQDLALVMGMVQGEGAIWVLVQRLSAGDPSAQIAAVVVRLDPASGRRLATIEVDTRAESLTVSPGAVWVANPWVGTVSRIDPATNKVIATVKVEGEDIAAVFGFGSVWVLSSHRAPLADCGSASPPPSCQEGTVSRIDPLTNRVISTTVVAGNPIRITVGPEAVWWRS